MKEGRNGMRRAYRDISLQKKMPVLFCSLLLLIILTAGIFLAWHYNNVFRQYFQENFSMAITTNANGVREVFRTVGNGMDVVCDNKSAYVTENKKNVSAIADTVLFTDPKEEGFDLHQMVEERWADEAMLKVLFHPACLYALLVPEEYPIAVYLRAWDGIENGFYKDRGMEAFPWYEKALDKKGENYWFQEEEFPERLYTARLLQYRYFTWQEGYAVKNLGMMVVGIDFSEIENRIDMTEMPERAQICILDENGRVLYTNGEKEGFLSEESLISVWGTTHDKIEYCEYQGEQYLVQKDTVAQGLELLTVIPADAINRMSLQMLGILLILLTVAFVVGMFLISLLSHAITAPIVRLAGRMETGILEPVEEEEFGNDEIGILYQGYNRMQEKIREMLKDVWESAEKQKNAELQLLQAQINPHFVYNSLGTISCHALLNGQDVIAKQLNMLVSIMRYQTREPDGLVPLEKEIGIIRQYAEIQKMSSGGTVQFAYSIAPECAMILIPKLIIQPLVENCIIHGFDSVRKDGQVEICAEMTEEGVIRITVTDNGRGGDMDAINRYIHGEESDEIHDSLGVKNVYDRIRRVYGPGGGLEYCTGPRGGAMAIITIQMKKEVTYDNNKKSGTGH